MARTTAPGDRQRRTGTNPKRVIVAGSSTLLVEALAAALALYSGVESPRSAANTTELLDKSRARRPDVAVLCRVRLDRGTTRIVSELRDAIPSVRIVVVTEQPTPRDTRDAAEAGAVACLSLEAGLWHLIEAIEGEP